MTISTGIDTASRVTNENANAFKAKGLIFVARYYSQDLAKALSAAEAQALSADGLYIIVVYEDNPTYAGYFSAERGLADAKRAVVQAKAAGQPLGSAIYFSIDYDCRPGDYTGIFASAAAFQQHVKESGYIEGAYGSGAILSELLDRGLIAKAWLAQSTGWSGYENFLMSGRWSLHQSLPELIRGIAVDSDASNGDAGGWRLQPESWSCG